ncbi:uncharacterized protein LOC121775255 [Salvia splendens]|nr:uncharacterized protein LOC121775255 [Salvia splendens]
MPPDANWIKLNTAGFWRDTEAGAGGVIRDKEGNIIQGTMARITATSTLDAELQALVIGVDAAREHDIRIWIEMDNKEVVTLLNAKRFGAAALRHLVTAIRNRIKQVEVRITHIRSQGNRVAEFLARHGSLERKGSMFNQGSAPARAKALARMDQLGMPSFCLREQSYHR